MKRATITLPDDLADRVDSEARRRQTSFSEVVQLLLVQGLAESTEKPRKIPWAGMVDDPEMVPAERMEEFLTEHWARLGDSPGPLKSALASPVPREEFHGPVGKGLR